MKTKHLMVPIGYTQFFASLLVILVHCGRLAENNGLHFLLKSLLCRLAVPFFLLLNGYFFKKEPVHGSNGANDNSSFICVGRSCIFP